jgi:hypothetical protein
MPNLHHWRQRTGYRMLIEATAWLLAYLAAVGATYLLWSAFE